MIQNISDLKILLSLDYEGPKNPVAPYGSSF